MGGLLTSKSTQTQKIDPTLALESESLIGLLRMLMGTDPVYNTGVTIAGMTPRQKAAMKNTSTAASAFGLDVPSEPEMPATTTSASGIEGYSIAPEVEASKAALPPTFIEMLKSFRDAASKPTPTQSFDSGGKK